MKKPLFIAFEGIDGSGKSTQIQLLSKKLEAKNHKTHVTFEPTKSNIGTIIRDAFVHKTQLDNRVIAGLFVADRLNHILQEENGILAILATGSHVLTDRFYFSSFAYQGAHMDLNWVINANAISRELCKPNLHIYIDVEPKLALSRITLGRQQTELYETFETLNAVRNKYMEAFDLCKETEKICIVNGNQSEEMVAAAIWEQVVSVL